MPTTTGVQNDILASTLRILRDKEVDNTFRTIPFLEAIQRLGSIEKVDGGSYIDHPVILTDHSNLTQLATGYEAISLAVRDPMRTASFSWCDFVAPVAMSGVEMRSNSGAKKIISILEARVKQTMGMLRREYEKQVLAGNSTTLSNLQSLNGIDAATGWFEELAFGSQTNSVGGIAKSGFPLSWQNQSRAVTTSFATTGLAQMQQLSIDIQQYAPEGDTDIILASPISYGLFKNELQALERYINTKEERDMVGKLALQFNGASMYISPNLGFTGSGGTNKMSMYFLNSKLFTAYFGSDAFFDIGDMLPQSGYDASVANIIVRTQLATSNLSGHGILTNAEA